MSEIKELGLNHFYDGEPLELAEPEEGEEISITYKFDYPNGLMFIYENHKFECGSECRLYKGEILISQMTKEQTRKIWDSGRASAFIYDNKGLYINIP